MVEHQFFQALDFLADLFFAHGFELRRFLCHLQVVARFLRAVDAVDHFADRFFHADRDDVVGRIESDLLGAAALRLVDGAAHGVRDAVAVQDRRAVQVTRGAPDGLDQAALGAQEAFLVRVEDGHQRHFRQVQALAQQVDAH